MMQEIDLEEAKGKTLKTFKVSQFLDQLVLVFEDATFTAIGVYGTKVSAEDLDINMFGDVELVEAGIFNSEELEEWHESRRRDERNAREQMDREAYARLKAQFEE